MDKTDPLAGNKSFTDDVPKVVLFDNLKVVKGVEEPVLAALVSFAKLVGADSTNQKVNFQTLDMGKP